MVLKATLHLDAQEMTAGNFQLPCWDTDMRESDRSQTPICKQQCCSPLESHEEPATSTASHIKQDLVVA